MSGYERDLSHLVSLREKILRESRAVEGHASTETDLIALFLDSVNLALSTGLALSRLRAEPRPGTKQGPSRWMDEREAAGYLRVAPGTLRNWRSSRQGPPYHRAGGRITYDIADLDAWMSSSRTEGE